MPTVSRHSPLQGTWETKCILDWNDDDTEKWLMAKGYQEFLFLELTGGATLAMCSHLLMLGAAGASKRKAAHLFNLVGLLIEEHKVEYVDRASTLQHCIKTRGKALPFSHKCVTSCSVSFASA